MQKTPIVQNLGFSLCRFKGFHCAHFRFFIVHILGFRVDGRAITHGGTTHRAATHRAATYLAITLAKVPTQGNF
jgi:hypothetical protein